MAVADLISQGFGGYQGWGETEAMADFAATGGSGKRTSGGSTSSGGSSNQFVGGIDESQLPSTLDYVNKLSETEGAALQDVVMAMKARKSPLEVYTGLEEASGLPQLRGTASTLSKEIANIEDTLESIEPDVAARTRESLVTEAQRRGMVTSQRAPHEKLLGKLSTSLGRVGELIGITERGVSNKAGLITAGQEQEIEPLKLQYQGLVDKNARLISGFNADKQMKFDILMDKINRQRDLSDQEWQLANTLSAEKREYTKELQKAAASAGYKVTGQESDDELLGIIGTKAAEEIAYSRRGSGTTAQKQQLSQDVLNKAAGGANLTDLQRDYGAKLGTETVVELYTSATKYGNPTEPYAQQILGTTPKTESGTGGMWFDELGNLHFD